MSDINIATATNGFVVTEKNLAIGQLSRTWVFTTPQELATFIADHFEPKIKATESLCSADALNGISALQRKVIYPISVKVTDQYGNIEIRDWSHEINHGLEKTKEEYPMYEIINESRQLVGTAGFEPFLADHLADVASPEQDLSDITASVIKRQGL